MNQTGRQDTVLHPPKSRNITVLVKPASAACNLHCDYCFYLETASNRQQGNRGVMQAEVARALVSTTLDFAAGGTVTYLFQGGEPLLAGLDFFKTFVSLVQAHQKSQREAGLTASAACYMAQTNGTALTKEFCQFFAEHKFILGISLDGPDFIHNRHRKYPAPSHGRKTPPGDATGKTTLCPAAPADSTASHRHVMEAIQLLRSHHIPFSILSVVTREWVGREKEIYSWFQGQGLTQLQLIHCIPPDAADQEFCLTNQEYSRLNKTLFQLYWQDLQQGKGISIRFYDNLLAMLRGLMPEQCGMLGYCPATITVEADGSLYPCDFYCDDKWYIGNIKNMGLKELFYHPVMQDFLKSSQKQETECAACPVQGLCRGGCRRERDRDGSGNVGLHPHCQGRKEFFTYLLEKVQGHR